MRALLLLLKGIKMVTTVELQGPMEYSLWVGFLGAMFIVAAVLIFVFIAVRILVKKKDKVIVPVKEKKPAVRKMMGASKNQYIQMVRDIKNRYTDGAITKRGGYQELSGVIREFMHEATGINVENLTASEVKAIGLRELDVLMEEYYVPEFAEDEKAERRNLANACDRAEGVIKAWS